MYVYWFYFFAHVNHWFVCSKYIIYDAPWYLMPQISLRKWRDNNWHCASISSNLRTDEKQGASLMPLETSEMKCFIEDKVKFRNCREILVLISIKLFLMYTADVCDIMFRKMLKFGANQVLDLCRGKYT